MAAATSSFPKASSAFYAAQDVKLPPLSLKELVCLPDSRLDYSDAQVAAALHKAGLGDFIEHLGRRRPRRKELGPGVLGRPEAEAGASPASCCSSRGCCSSTRRPARSTRKARIAFHQAIKDNCPGITVISIMHEAEPPRSATGAEFYDSVLTIDDGAAVKRPIAANPARPVPAVVETFPVETTRARLSRIIKTKAPSREEVRQEG